MTIEHHKQGFTRQILSLNKENILAIAKNESQIREWLQFGRKNKLLTAGPVGSSGEVRFLNLQAVEALGFLINIFHTIHKPEKIYQLIEKMEQAPKETPWVKYMIFGQAFLEVYIWALKQKITLEKSDESKENLEMLLCDAESDKEAFLETFKEDRTHMQLHDRIAAAIKDIPGPSPLLLPSWLTVANSCLSEPDEYKTLSFDKKLEMVLDNKEILLQKIEKASEEKVILQRVQKGVFKIADGNKK